MESQSVKVIRPAATLLLVRDGVRGIEVLTLKRSAAMRFLPGYLAFPGGAIDAQDEVTATSYWTGALQGQEQTDDATYAAGAIRECAEEVGWLCATTQGREMNLKLTEQSALLEGTTTVGGLLNAYDAKVFGNLLRFVGRWVTPAAMPARFDTRFFIYHVKGQAMPVHMQSAENEWIQWHRPEDLLARIESATERAVPPTIAMLKALVQCGRAKACFETMAVPGPTPEP
jgi:8-oxo-dGTP pyrophosphatase MutT (NUDIX family)